MSVVQFGAIIYQIHQKMGKTIVLRFTRNAGKPKCLDYRNI